MAMGINKSWQHGFSVGIDDPHISVYAGLLLVVKPSYFVIFELYRIKRAELTITDAVAIDVFYQSGLSVRTATQG